jgi:hypothetical protein
MTYRQLQTALKALRQQGHKVPKLNSKKAVLQAAYDQLTADTPKARKARRQAEIDQFCADLGLGQLYADCDRYGINVECFNPDEEQDRHNEFLSNLAIQTLQLAA